MEPGPNLAFALVLSEYTEILGGFVRGKFNHRECAANYRRFLEYMGEYYVQLNKKICLYKVVRCGLAHEYLMKGPSTVVWRRSDHSQMGLYIDNGRIIFNCEAYFIHWKTAVSQYFRDLKNNTSLQQNLINSITQLDSRQISTPLFRVEPKKNK
jgi:hypothetical protein